MFSLKVPYLILPRVLNLYEDVSLEIGYVLHKAPDLRKELIQKYGIKQTANNKIGHSF